ncbi:MAG: GNAT family N-acetyltransferase [Chloroflexota bacterium]
MNQINAAQITPVFKSLFRSDDPQPVRCFTVLEGSNPGNIFVDDIDNPTWGLVQETYDNTIYLGGDVDPDSIATLIEQLKETGPLAIGLWPGDPRSALLPPAPLYGHTVLEFYDRPVGERLEPLLNAVPEGCEVRRMDRDLIMRSEWGPDDVAYAGGLDQWEAKCIGYCLLRDDKIMSEATVGPGALGLREPGVFTQEAHRGNGYGTIVMAHLVQEIEAMGEQTFWNCTESNVASASIARKLGYRVEKSYKLVGWS